MAAKSELSGAPGIQNVVVYVSNDNFAHAYAVGQQNVGQGGDPVIPNGTYPPHSMAPVGPSKSFPDKLKPTEYPNNGLVPQAGNFFSNNAHAVISQNGFPVNNIAEYQNINVLNQIKNAVTYSGNNELLSGERQSGPGRPELNKVRDECEYMESGYVVCGEGQSVRCDSVRSETAESSCSSLSSTDEGLVVVPQGSDMVVYDNSVSVRPGVVLTVGPTGAPQTHSSASLGGTLPNSQQSSITVPFGWKRLLTNGLIIYISPNNTALSSLEQVKEYLLTPGTCKCGLECPLKYDSVFNFDPKVLSKPWTLSPDTNTGDLTKLCNHKRKIIAMASLGCKPPDPSKLPKDLINRFCKSSKVNITGSNSYPVCTQKHYNNKRKKRKSGGSPYAGVSVSQILAQREKLNLPQHFNKESPTNLQLHQQIWPGSPANTAPQNPQNRLQGYHDNSTLGSGTVPQFYRYQNQEPQINRVLSGSPMVVGETMLVQPPSSSANISQQMSHAIQNQQLLPHLPNPTSQSSPNVHIHHQQIIGPNGQVINIHNPGSHIQNNSQMPGGNVNAICSNILTNTTHNNVVIQGQNIVPSPSSQRIYINSQPSEPSGPGRPNIQMVPVSISSNRPEMPQKLQQPFYNQPPQYQVQHFDPSKNVRPPFLPNNQVINGFPIQQNISNNQIQGPVALNQQHHQQQQQQQQQQQHQQQKMWQNRMQPMQQNPVAIPVQSPQNAQNIGNIYERVPPLHQHTPPPNSWQDEINRKKVKMGKTLKKRSSYVIENQHRMMEPHAPCPNIDVRQIPGENNRIMINQFSQPNQGASSPSFMEDPSGYLAQQTALLNNTINRQTGANGCSNYICSSPVTSVQSSSPQHNLAASNTQPNGVPLPSNMLISQLKPSQNFNNRLNQNMQVMKQPVSVVTSQQYTQMLLAQGVPDSSDNMQCQGCVADSIQYQDNSNQYKEHLSHKVFQNHARPDSQPGTPSSSGTGDDPVTSSTYNEKPHTSPDTRPIQGGTISTSNVSPQDGSPDLSHTPTPTNRNLEIPQLNIHNQNMHHYIFPSQAQIQQINQSRDTSGNPYQNQPKLEGYCPHPHTSTVQVSRVNNTNMGIVTTMASGRTVGSNTITSVLAGRANTATVSINTPPAMPPSANNTSTQNSLVPIMQSHPVTVNVTKSPLEMVQSVVSSIQVPQSQVNQQMSPQQIIKPPQQNLPPGHIFVSSGGQLLMANTGNQPGVMAPPPPKIMSNQGAMPPISVSPMITNVTAAVTQVIPAVAQQVLGQQTVLVNALPAPFVLQPGVTMTMDGMTVGQNMQIPHLVTGNVIQQQIQIDGSEPRRAPALLSPETKRKGKKRKLPSQTVASMLHIAAQQNSGVVMSQQGFPQQIQMAHSPQSITTTPVMQALTIVPGKAGGPPQIVMNGQPMANTGHIGAQQLITNSQPAQQINLLQPVNLLNGATSMVQNFPTIQQFIVPNLGGMVMNADGTATILQDTSNLGMQLQLQNVNGQNVLTPVQNNNVFNSGQSILTAGPAGMVIRAPGTPQGKIIQQQHSPGAQFLSPNGGQFVVNGAQFSGQLSPLVANVSPTQQVTFGAAPQAIRPTNNVPQPQQEFIQCGQMGQTLMVPCTPAGSIAVSTSNQQNTTYVQQNTTIVQQQTTMVSNNQPLQNFQPNNQQNQQNMARATTLNVDQNFIIASNEKSPVQALLLQRRSPQAPVNYRQSVSTQTAVSQNAQSVTTNTFCQTSTTAASSPPDTTTHSPLASGGQSPPTADTTTHSGSTDDGLSPAPSNCSGSCSDIVSLQARQQSSSMAMVHCISSSEPDSADINTQSSENDWTRNSVNSTPKMDFTDISSVGQIQLNKKPNTPTHIAYAESSTMISGMQFVMDQMKSQEAVVSSRNYDKAIPKRKHSDTLVVMETRHMHSSLFDDDEESETKDSKSPHSLVTGDLVWGPAKGCPAWPGKLVQVCGDKVLVRWFGGDKSFTEVDPCNLQTLTEGLDAHHRARKNSRTSRKLNTQLEKAIQEAMAELDKVSDTYLLNQKNDSSMKETVTQPIIEKKTTGRLRSSQR